MAFIGNRSVLHKSPGRWLNGNAATGGGIAVMRSAFNQHGMMRNAFEQYDAKAAIPYGHLSPSAWVLPKRAGGMSSRNVTKATFAASGLAVGGITTTGTAALVIDFSTATAALIASGAGTASLTFTVANALLTASIGGVGAASFSFTATGQPGALASGSGSASMAITFANAQPYPLNDASPLRTGTASFAINGTLVPYAIGVMGGSTVDNSILTVDAIAAGVLAAALTSPIRANIKQVNDVSVSGTGAPGNEWGPV